MTYYNITNEDLDCLMEVVDRRCYGCYGEENSHFCDICYIKDIQHSVAEWCYYIKNTHKRRNEMITKIKNMPEEEFLELYKSAFEYDDKYKDFDEYCGCVKDGLNSGFCDEDCEECRQAWLNKKSDSTNHIENSLDYPTGIEKKF